MAAPLGLHFFPLARSHFYPHLKHILPVRSYVPNTILKVHHKKCIGILSMHFSSGEEYFSEPRNTEEWDAPRALFPRNFSINWNYTESSYLFVFSQKCNLLWVKGKTLMQFCFIGLLVLYYFLSVWDFFFSCASLLAISYSPTRLLN